MRVKNGCVENVLTYGKIDLTFRKIIFNSMIVIIQLGVKTHCFNTTVNNFSGTWRI